MREPQQPEGFERVVMPHLQAGYNLARWLTRDDHDAEDVVQEAYLRAFRSFDRYRGGDARAWVLTIVRNTCYTWLRRHRAAELATGDGGPPEVAAEPQAQPEVQFARDFDRRLLREALEALPAEFREALVLRELEGLSYKEIADVTDAPLGTVMSRLSRGRERAQQFVQRRLRERG